MSERRDPNDALEQIIDAGRQLELPGVPMILADGPPVEADLTRLDAPALHARARRPAELRDLRRRQTAEEAIAELDRETEIFGFTKGQFSLIDLIRAVIKHTGPAHMSISTWTAAGQDVTAVLDFMATGHLTDCRWLVDLTFNRRSPELAHRIRQAFGRDAIRVARNHAKFAVLRTAGPEPWAVVIRTSMNLNFNPRFEDFTLAHDPDLAEFLDAILDDVWSRQARDLADATPQEIKNHFRDL